MFRSIVFYGTPTVVNNLMPNLVYIYIYIYKKKYIYMAKK